MCNCGKRANADTYTVKYPDGRTESKPTKVAAKLAAAAVSGASYEKTGGN